MTHGPLDHRDRVLGHDADRRVHHVDLAGAEFAVDGFDFRLEGDQHVADVALQEGGGGVAAAARASAPG